MKIKILDRGCSLGAVGDVVDVDRWTAAAMVLRGVATAVEVPAPVVKPTHNRAQAKAEAKPAPDAAGDSGGDSDSVGGDAPKRRGRPRKVAAEPVGDE